MNLEHGFPLSEYLLKKNFRMRRNTRMLGLKSLDRTATADIQETDEKSIRCLLVDLNLSPGKFSFPS